VTTAPVTTLDDTTRPRRAAVVRAWLLAFALFVALSLLLVINRVVLNERQAPVALSLLMVVLFGSVMGGRTLGLALALSGYAVIDYYFQVPYGDFGVHDPADLLVLVSFVATADVASRLLARAQEQADEARRRAAEVQRLADLGAETLAAPLSSVALGAITDVVARTLRLDRCELWDIADDGEPRCVAVAPNEGAPEAEAGDELAGTPADEPMRARLLAVAAVAPPTTADERARRLGAVLAGAPSDALLQLAAHGHVVGALRLCRADGLALDESGRTFLQALAHYAALGVERARLASSLRLAEIQRETDRMRDFLLASVSHDLRTPLTTIKALAHERARAGDRGAATIEEQADRLTRLVTDLLDLSRARAGALPLTPEINTAEDVVGAALRQVAGVLHGRTVETRLRGSGGALVGHFDFVATLRILGNLLENAAKYSPADEPIRVHIVREGGMIAFSVRDRGAGVREQERERIFAPFHRAAGAPPDVGSAGLGLAVARALAEAQGGSLAYAPREGGGSDFTLRLPASHDALALELITGESTIASDG
jgi:two-component system, OmpR family, sensor histidine kinase KdpD